MPSLPPLAPLVGTVSDTGAVVVQLSDSVGQPWSHVSSTATERVSMISATRGVVNVEIRRDGVTEYSSECTNASTDGMGMHGVSGIDGAPFLNKSEIVDGSQDFGQKPKKTATKTPPPSTTTAQQQHTRYPPTMMPSVPPLPPPVEPLYESMTAAVWCSHSSGQQTYRNR